MDKINFKQTKIKYGADDTESDAVEIFVNGKNFLKKIHDYETLHNINGGHVPIMIHELYQSLAEDYLKESVPIYGCGCGVVDCSPVYVSVNVDENFVTWDKFVFPDEFFNPKKNLVRNFASIFFKKPNTSTKLKNLNIGFLMIAQLLSMTALIADISG